jgi:hypothetical protein
VRIQKLDLRHTGLKRERDHLANALRVNRHILHVDIEEDDFTHEDYKLFLDLVQHNREAHLDHITAEMKAKIQETTGFTWKEDVSSVSSTSSDEEDAEDPPARTPEDFKKEVATVERRATMKRATLLESENADLSFFAGEVKEAVKEPRQSTYPVKEPRQFTSSPGAGTA